MTLAPIYFLCQKTSLTLPLFSMPSLWDRLSRQIKTGRQAIPLAIRAAQRQILAEARLGFLAQTIHQHIDAAACIGIFTAHAGHDDVAWHRAGIDRQQVQEVELLFREGDHRTHQLQLASTYFQGPLVRLRYGVLRTDAAI